MSLRPGPTNPFTVFEAAEIEQSLAARFESQVRLHGSRPAIGMDDRELTYEELDRAANRVAHAILARRGAGAEAVGLLFAPDSAAIAAILGVLKANKFFVPLDPSYPEARLAAMLVETRPRLVVTDARHAAIARRLCPEGCEWLEIEAVEQERFDGSPGLTVSADALAYVLYTSGSTGQPKGVVQNQRNVLYDIRHHTNILRLAADARLTLLSSFSVVAGVRDVFCALLNGASIHPFDVKAHGVANLAPWLQGRRITNYKSIPTVFRHLAGSLAPEARVPGLRVMQIGGEPVYRSDVELFQRHFPAPCVLVQLLGATEVQNYAYHFMDQDTWIGAGHTVPLAFDPIAGTAVLLLDEAGEDVGVGRPGEISVQSRYIALGYWGRPDLTEAAFLPDPHGRDERIYRTGDLGIRLPDGRLEHVGRKDLQIKIRGFRVETAEVEGALASLEGVKEAAVVVQANGPGEPRLVAYVVPAAPPGPTVATLRRLLAERLPPHMIPSTFVALERLALMPSGKVDRRALPPPDRSRPALEHRFVAPRTPVEAAVATIWRDVLDLDTVGIYDPFLELGGDSLLAARIVARLLEGFHLDLPQRLLLETDTVAGLATVVTQHLAEKGKNGAVERWLAEVEAHPDGPGRGSMTR